MREVTVFEKIRDITEEIARLQKDREKAIQAAVQALNKGATTGDPLLDNLWHVYQQPPAPENVERFRKAAVMLKGHAGQLVVVVQMKEGESGVKALESGRGLHADPEPPPSYLIFLGRLAGDELIFQNSVLFRCVLPTVRFAEIEPYHSKPITIKKGNLGCFGFPNDLDVPLPYAHPDYVLYLEEDLVHVRMIVGNDAVISWAKKFHHGMHADVCRAALKQLD